MESVVHDIPVINQLFGGTYFILCSFTILYYDYALTICDEILYVWGKKRNWATIVFLVTRYLTMLGSIPVWLWFFRRWDASVCTGFQTYHQIFSITVQVLVAIVLTMRVYALYEHSLRVLSGMLIVGLGGIAVAFWSFFNGSKSRETVESLDYSNWNGCINIVQSDAGLRFAVAWGALLVFDTLIFLLTLYKAVSVWREGAIRVVKLLLYDGSLYFGVLSIAVLSNIVSFLVLPPVLRGISTDLANNISVTMIARLMINLRKGVKSSNVQAFSQGRSATVATVGVFAHPGQDITTTTAHGYEDDYGLAV